MAENEVAHAGIGVDVGVNGLDQLVKTNSLMENVRQNAERLHDMTANIITHVQNLDTFKGYYDKAMKMRNVDSHVNFKATGQQEIHDDIEKVRQKINKDVHMQLLGTDYVNHEIEYLDKPAHKDIKFNVDTGAIDQVHTSFRKIDDDADKARHKTLSLAEAGKKIHGVFSGSFLGNAMSNAFSSIASSAKSAIASGIKLAETGDEVRESWQHIGVGNNNANQMVGQMDKLRDMAGMDEQSIQRMQKSFYTLTGSAPQARSLVNEVSAFGKASGESNQEITRMGTMLPRMLSTGKVRAQMFNRTFGQSGELVNALAKASGHSASSFRQLVDSGKMTSQELQQYMQKAAKGSSRAWAQYDRTFRGQMQTIKGSVTEAKEDFAKPFVNNLTKSLNQTEKSGTGLQKVQASIHQITNELGKRVGVFAGKAIGYIVKNQHALFKTGSALFRIVGELASGAWKTVTFPLRMIDNLFNLMAGRSMKAHHGLVTTGNVLTWVANHRKSVEALGGALATAFAAWKFMKFAVAVHKVYTAFKALSIIHSIVTMVKSWTTAQTVLDGVLDANPIGAVVVAITAAIAAIAGVVAGLHHLYVHCVPARHAMQAIGHAGVVAFKAITWPERMVIKLLGGIIKSVWNASSGLRHKMALGFDIVKRHAEGFYRSSLYNSNKWGREFGSWISGNGWKYRRNQTANAHAAEISHRKIDSYRKNSSGKFRAYISKNGQIYRKYHKGTTRISEATFKQHEAIRRQYHERYVSSLKKYEANYKKYESKRSSLSRRYGKLRAMYSEKSLKTIENRFKGLRNTVVRYAKMMFHDTQRIFKRLGTGAIRQFRGIYRAVRKYMRMSIREDTRDFKQIYRINRHYLNGSVLKYVHELQYRYKRQRYYDRQLVKQAKATAKSMYHLPIGWITRETKDLIANWRHQRRSYLTHNERMTHAEETHLHTMTRHLDTFGDHFQKLMSDLEDSVYDGWSKFWTKMHNRAGSGMNAVQAPLNSGAMHINSFVRAFGESTDPMHEMPEVSYKTGTGFRKPITQMTDAVLNDGLDSPETNHQETVIHPDGNIEFPKGQNIHEMLEPGTEVLNATETKMMGEMAQLAPTIHYSTGTGALNKSINNDNSVVNNSTNNATNPIKSLTTSIAHNINNVPHITNQDISNAIAPQSNPIVVKPNVNVTPTVHLATGTDSLGRIINNSNSSSIGGSTINHAVNDVINNTNSSRPVNPKINVKPTIHLASGTGLFGGLFGQMSNWIKSAINGNDSGDDYSTIYEQAKGSGDHKLLNVLQKVLSHSEQVLSGFMGHAPTGYNGVLGDITKGIYGQTSNQIDDWWKALMNLTGQALNNGGSSSAMLNFAEKNFSGIPYSMGGESHAAADCSGAVDMIAKHFGVDLPRTTTGMENDPSQLQYIGKDEGRARAGDLVLFGHGNGAAGHVGIYTGRPDEMWNETPPRSRVSKISDAESVVSLAGFYRLKKLANDNNSSLSFKGANSGLMKFVKKQENPMFKWIAKHLAPLLDPNPGGSGVARWRPYIERAAQQMHVHLTTSGLDKILSNIRHESGGDPTVTQHGYVDQNTYTHPAQGLVQFIPPTFNHYAVAGHHNIKSGYDQLLALFNDSSWYSDIAPGGGWSPSGSRRMQSGGHINAGEVATVGEQGEELFKPDNSGVVIPHNATKRILNNTTNNNKRPVEIHQHNTYNVTGGDSKQIIHAIDHRQSANNENLMEKLNRLIGGNDEGGILV